MPMFTRLPAALLVASLAALCWPDRAHAAAVYGFTLQGEMHQESVSWDWTGRLKITLDGAADGLYDNTHILAFDMASTSGPSFRWPEDFSPIPFIVFVDVEKGAVASIGGIYYASPYPEETSFTGLSVSYYHPLVFKTPETFGDAILTPVAVPEPGTWTMLLLGLGLVAAGGRRKWARRPV